MIRKAVDRRESNAWHPRATLAFSNPRMSLKAGSEAIRRQASFLIRFGGRKNSKRESGKPAFGFPLFRASPPLWKCGNRVVCDFQGLWTPVENLPLVFLGVTRPSFPQP